MKKCFAAVVYLLLTAALNGLFAQAPGPTPDEDPTGNTGALKPQIQTGGSYLAHSGNGTRIVPDLDVPGALGVYGLDFIRYWNSLPIDHDNPDASTPDDFGSAAWSHSWRWVATYGEQGPEPIPGGNEETNEYYTSITITFPDGHANKYKIRRLGHGDNGTIGDPRFGPPYDGSTEADWSRPGGNVHDLLEDMAPDGSEFWLHRADGGSVHFRGDSWVDSQGHKWWFYQADKVFDPNGLRTDLTYNANGHLERVEQEGGRWLTITWGYPVGWSNEVITQVASGGSAGTQVVNYGYSAGAVLSTVTYPNDPAPGWSVSAIYTYEPDNDPDPRYRGGLRLVTADDPRFAGPMRSIRYSYRGSHCDRPGQPPNPLPPGYYDRFYALSNSIAAERSANHLDSFGQHVLVSGFSLNCWDGTRLETNGFGAWRKFFFGRSASWPGSGSHGHELAKITDFTLSDPETVPSLRQSHLNGNPYQVWDGRGLITQLAYGDASGSPSEVRHLEDGSFRSYDRINPSSNSAERDPAYIHNPYSHWLFSKRDENSHTTTYTRDYRRRVKQIDYSGGSNETFVYDNYAYNGLNQVTHHWLPSGGLKRYVYDARGLLEREWNDVDGEANAIIYTYDSLHRVETISHPWSRAKGAAFSVKMTYNGRHKVIREEYPATDGGPNPSKTYEYNKYGDCEAITDEMGHRSTYSYDMYGRCTSYIEPLNATDGNGQIVSSRRWDWIYDRWVVDVGHVPSPASHTSNEWRVLVAPAFNSSGERHVTGRVHDVNNRLVYEQSGWIQRPYPAALGDWYYSDTYSETHSFTYDANGNKKTFTDPRGRVTEYEYDLRNRVKKTIEYPVAGELPSAPRVTETQYDVAGNKTKVIFPDQQKQEWLDYDAFGQARQFKDERNNTTALNYQWGPMKILDNVITYRQRDGGGGTEPQKTDFDNDKLGRLRWTIFPDGSAELKDYQLGQFVAFKTRNDETKRIYYDARGREDYHTWDSNAAPGIDREWDNANRLITISNSVAALSFGYDDASQLLSESRNVTGAGGQAGTRYVRYANGTIWQMRYPNGMWIARDYRPQGELQTVWDNGPNSWRMVINYGYHLDGKVDYANYGNGVTTDIGYDGRGMISSVHHKKTATGENLSYRQYFRDTRDRIYAWKKSTTNSLNAMENGRGERYEYDAEGQLTRAYYGVPNPEVSPDGYQFNDHFGGWENDVGRGYDALGNRQGWNYQPTSTWTWYTRRNNGLNQYVDWSPSDIYYDDNFQYPRPPYLPPGNGVLMADGWITASYNALNQPIAMWSFAYQGTANYMWFGYDPLGRCVKRWVGPSGSVGSNPATYLTSQPLNASALISGSESAGSNPATTYLYYDGWNLIQEGPSAGSADRQYIHGARVDEIVKQITPHNGWERFFHYDARATCTHQTDAFANLVEQYEYGAFGKPYFYDGAGNSLQFYDSASGSWRGYSPWGNRFLFTGREWLSDLNIYDYRNRMYQPELGRFLQPDPKGFDGGDYNLYRYCHNDPVNNTDPFGLEFFPGQFQEVTAIPNEPGLVGLTTPKLELSIQMVQAPSGGFTLQSKVDVRITSKLVATTANGRPRDRAAIEQTKVHENKHEDVARKWHDANQNKVPKGPFKTADEAVKAAKEAGDKIKADFNRTQEIDKQHKPDSVWKSILDKDR